MAGTRELEWQYEQALYSPPPREIVRKLEEEAHPGGVVFGNLGRGVRPAFGNPDQNM